MEQFPFFSSIQLERISILWDPISFFPFFFSLPLTQTLLHILAMNQCISLHIAFLDFIRISDPRLGSSYVTIRIYTVCLPLFKLTNTLFNNDTLVFNRKNSRVLLPFTNSCIIQLLSWYYMETLFTFPDFRSYSKKIILKIKEKVCTYCTCNYIHTSTHYV